MCVFVVCVCVCMRVCVFVCVGFPTIVKYLAMKHCYLSDVFYTYICVAHICTNLRKSHPKEELVEIKHQAPQC